MNKCRRVQFKCISWHLAFVQPTDNELVIISILNWHRKKTVAGTIVSPIPSH